ncbi:MAG: cbb3-type cytochrome c oxidase subunit I [Opitutaceae bacterium]|nr:cbb3-type cytochrome c oxidase subunit I [Opitutaceae bacterium]
MNLIGNLCSSLCSNLEGDAKNREAQRTIDAAIRFPLLSIFKASIVWMLIATVFGLIASIKLHTPGFIEECQYMTYGKVEPIFWNTLIYGWLFNAGLGCAVFLLARIGGTPLKQGVFLTITTVIWNLAVVIGVVGIILGDQLPYKWLEFPSYTAPILFISFLGIGLWCAMAFRSRVQRTTYASQWWILTALFSFAWIYSAAQIMLVCSPAQGAFQTLVSAWYAENVFGLLIAPLAFATIYYLIPKTLGIAVVGYRYTGIAFWSWILFASVAGTAKMVNGPIPVWVASVGVIATFGLLLPTTTFSIQFLGSLLSRFSKIWDTASARFLIAGVLSFIVTMLFKSFGALRGSQEVVQFSIFESGVNQLALFGFAGMVFTGASYFILPRLLNKEFPSPTLVDLQFWAHGMGLVLLCIGSISGGIQQGELINGSTADMLVVVNTMRSSYFLASMGLSFILVGAIAYNVTFFWMLLSARSKKEASTSLIEEAPELEYTAS